MRNQLSRGLKVQAGWSSLFFPCEKRSQIIQKGLGEQGIRARVRVEPWTHLPDELLAAVSPTVGAQVCRRCLLLAWTLDGRSWPAYAPETCHSQLPRLAGSHLLQCGLPPPTIRRALFTPSQTVTSSLICPTTHLNTISGVSSHRWLISTSTWAVYQGTLDKGIYEFLGTPGCYFLGTSSKRK